jgi:hypothetical protein
MTTIATDALADLVVSGILDRVAELEALVDAGLPMEDELAVARALLQSFPQSFVCRSRVLH